MSKDKLTTQELIDLLAQKAGVSKKTAEEFLKAFFLTIEDSLLANDLVKIRNFGTFKKQWNEARKSINVRTGEEIQIEGFNKVIFVPESKLKELVNEPYSHLEPLQLDDDVVEIKTESIEEIYSPLQIFTDQASEIKDILSEINALSVMHSATGLETEIQETDFILPVENQQDYLETDSIEPTPQGGHKAESLAEVVEEEVEIETKSEDVQLGVEIIELIQSAEPEIVEEEVVEFHSGVINEESIQIEDNKEVSVQNDEPGAIESAVVLDEINRDSHLVELEINAKEKEIELIQSDNLETESDSELNPEEFSLHSKIETIEPTIENELDSSRDLDENQIDETEILVEKPKKKKGFLIAFIVIFALTVAFVVNYYLSSATRCWIKYTLLSEENSEKLSNLSTTASDWFTGVKSWFDKKPKSDSEQTTPKKILKRVVSSDPVAIPDSTTDTLVITQNKVISVQGKLAIDTVKTEPKHIEKIDSLKQLFDGPRVYKTFYGTEKIGAGSRLTLISLKYYGQRDFWVYIYEANQALIQDPDRIPLGTVLKIPKLDNRLIDRNNPRCLKKAKELHDLYVSKK